MASSINFSDENLEQFSADLIRLSADYRGKPEVRAELDADPRSFFASRGVELQAGADFRVVANTADVFHMVLPPNPNATLEDKSLEGVAGGTGAQASTFSTVIGTVSSAGTTSDGSSS